VRAFNIGDLRRCARRRLPRMVFDYIDGGADDECTLRANVQRFRDYELTWNALRNIAVLDTATTVLGSPTKLPFLICPTATSRLFYPQGGERRQIPAPSGSRSTRGRIAGCCARC
jgi:L-lactate dehydrogenase (cytochrome)